MEQQPVYGEEITIRDLIQRVRGFWHEILRYWHIPVFCALLVAAFKAYQYYTYVPLYPASITFSVDEDEGGSASALTGILGQFGLGSVRPTRFNLDKIMALSKSRRVIQETLFAKVTVNGKEDFLANHLLREYKLNEADPKKKTKAFLFTHDSLPIFTLEENQKLMELYGFIIGPKENPKKALMTADYNEDTNIMSIDAKTTDDTLSLQLAQRMFESLSGYYVSKTIEKQLKIYNIVAAKRDSVLAALKAAEYQLASFKDTHRSLLMRTDQITELRLQREITALAAMYGEVLKNTEAASFSLKTKTPFIQVIDAPIPPVQPILLSLIRQLVIGLIIGGVIGGVFVLGRKLYREIVVPAQAS